MSFLQVFSGVLEGLRVTALVTLLGLTFALPFALLAGVAQHVSHGVPRLAVTAVIEFWRSTPTLILLYGVYYLLPSYGIRLPGMFVASMVLGLHIGGYGSQAVRAALQAVEGGQVEAGRSLGLRRSQILLLVELPQAFLAMTPTFVNLFIQLVKSTALVSLITLSDMTFRARELSQIEYAPVTIYTALLLAYLMLLYPATVAGRWLERKAGGARRLADGL